MLNTRFAPSPTGYLHLGHAYSAYFAWQQATKEKGKFFLRIEDIDASRSRPCYTSAIYEDLAWLGLNWEPEVIIQSEHLADYQKALLSLLDKGLIYKCFCTRKEIKEQAEKIFGAPHDNETIIYTGTCRNKKQEEQKDLEAQGRTYSLRLNIDKTETYLKSYFGSADLYWEDKGKGTILADYHRFGDVILARKDCPASYYLACVIDDARQDITLVTRGEDLFNATDIQVLLQKLLGLPTPLYHHHKLICDSKGQRLAKRCDSASIRQLKEEGATPNDILAKFTSYD